MTARQIIASHNLRASAQSLEQLVSHLTEPRWHPIFLLTVTMLPSADSLVQLMKQQIDAIVAHDPELQDFLAWANHKSLATPTPPAAIRAFHFALANRPYLVPHLALASTLNQRIFLDLVLDDLVLKCAINSVADFTRAQACIDALNNALIMVLSARLHHSLQDLKDQLPDPVTSPEFQAWWQTNHLVWLEQLKVALALERQTQHQWEFSPEQQYILQQYYDANQLLLDCLNSNCEVTPAVRQEIESALLLPQEELENREWGSSF